MTPHYVIILFSFILVYRISANSNKLQSVKHTAAIVKETTRCLCWFKSQTL
uniref:Uncharacterized protein n=1 Tax=Parascaris equorum TaxID=6256 RepID=A0A914RB87_PAREQ